MLLANGTFATAHDDDVLRFVATGADVETLACVQRNVGEHLARFAAREELRVSWART